MHRRPAALQDILGILATGLVLAAITAFAFTFDPGMPPEAARHVPAAR